MDDQASPHLTTFPEDAPLASVPVAPLVPAEAPPRTSLEAVGDAVYKLTHHGEAAPPQPAEALPVVTLPSSPEAPASSHVAALGERRPTTAEAIASAMSAVDAASHALKVAARSESEEGQGRGA